MSEARSAIEDVLLTIITALKRISMLKFARAVSMLGTKKKKTNKKSGVPTKPILLKY